MLFDSSTTVVRRCTGDTFANILRLRASETPHRQAFVFLDPQGAVADELTFAALDDRARIIATELIALGLSGTRILLLFPPGLDFVAALFGCFYAGAVAVPLPHSVGKRVAERIAAIRMNADPAGILTLARTMGDPELRGAFLGDDKLTWIYTDTIPERTPRSDFTMASADELALLQYTSGSTSTPKGVMLSHANLTANSAMIAGAFGHDEMLRGVGWLPLFHDMGLVGHVLQPVYVGGLSVLMSPLSFLQRPIRWLRAVSDWKATTSGGPTHGYELCIRAIRAEQTRDLDLSSWTVAYCGSEKVHADTLDRFGERFEAQGFRKRSFYPCYGLAEATLLVTGNCSGAGLTLAQPNRAADQSSSPRSAVGCGCTWGGASVVIANPDDRTRQRDGDIGEIWVAGPHVALGYWRERARTNETFRARLADGSGFYLRTGDLGFVADGQLFVVGRIKDTIVIRGLKYSAEDIEATVARSHSAFAGLAGAAFGIEVDGQEHAVVIQEIKSARGVHFDERSEAALSAFGSITREHGLRLADLLLVRVGSLPRTSSGKVQRARSRAIYSSNGFERLNGPGTLFALGRTGATVMQCNGAN